MDVRELHKAQISILRTLRRFPAVRYTDLCRPTGLESDVFKFHLRKLVHGNYVRKLVSGEYELTPSGKEFANNLSKIQPTVQKQPKLSVAIIAGTDAIGATKYLFQQRLRHPFFGFWAPVTGPVQWGESAEVAAQREFEKQTGLEAAAYEVGAFYRKTDYDTEAGLLLEDKLFMVVKAIAVRGELSNAWRKGRSHWMTLDDLEAQEKYFASTREFIEMLNSGETYRSRSAYYMSGHY